MLKKRDSLIILLIGTIFAFVFAFAKEVGICSITMLSCYETFDPLAEMLLICVVGLIMLGIAVLSNQYESWIKFARVWIPLTMLCVFLAPEYAHDLMLPIEKGTVAFGMSAVFLVVSLCIIAWKYIGGKSNAR